MKLYGGIDLHSNNSVVALLDEEDRVLYRKRLGNDAALVLEALAPYREAITGLVVESTYNWYWLVDALMDAGYRVHLANTAAIVQYSGKRPGNYRIAPSLLRSFIFRLCGSSAATASGDLAPGRCSKRWLR